MSAASTQFPRQLQSIAKNKDTQHTATKVPTIIPIHTPCRPGRGLDITKRMPRPNPPPPTTLGIKAQPSPSTKYMNQSCGAIAPIGPIHLPLRRISPMRTYSSNRTGKAKPFATLTSKPHPKPCPSKRQVECDLFISSSLSAEHTVYGDLMYSSSQAAASSRVASSPLAIISPKRQPLTVRHKSSRLFPLRPSRRSSPSIAIRYSSLQI